MSDLDGYYLRKKEQSELHMGEILYHKSMKPEEKLEKLYEIVEPMEFGVDPNANYQQRFFSEFNNSERMYPKMLKGQRKSLWDRRYSEMEDLIETRNKAKSQVHTNFMLSNPELELVKDLHNTEYGKGLMAEVARNQRRRPESGTGESIHDELERDSVDMEAIPQFQSKPFMIPGKDESFAKLDLERDDNGRVIRRSFDVYPIKIEYRYEYDGEGRLKNVYCDRNTTEDYRYGEYGERIAIETYRGRPNRYTYNDNLQLVLTGKIKYNYDDKGCLISRNEFGEITQYSYLESGPLCEVILPDGKRIEYTYNAVGQRVSKAVNGKIVETYLWQDLTTLLVVADEKGNNAKIFRYDEEGDPIGMIYQDKKYLFATDQVGTIFLVADDKGNELKRVIYDSFGNLLVDTNKKFDTCVGFAAGLADKDTGLVHFGYREYDPRIGRFITPDPVGFAGGDVDVYGYCLDDPINFVDRTGLAQVHERRLKGLEWLDGPIVNGIKEGLKKSPMGVIYAPLDGLVDKALDVANIKLKHEYIKYDKADESKNEKSNSGFSSTGVKHDEKGDSTPVGEHFDDHIMRQAEKNIDKTGKYKEGKYKVVGNNCQDYTDDVRKEYKRLQN
ncbi:RHS repeat domain-containing protein [Maridesulfovibrio frigidus]|uniref:RHS repeat domain-containing protein n=1 Tax=Maridesulfovibrio frigidus TaxID=340956 RepID=UPI0004E13D72|nr:RHS repeat-associated core domain-containing protein [Maridesulfovibrio frigidus]